MQRKSTPFSHNEQKGTKNDRHHKSCVATPRTTNIKRSNNKNVAGATAEIALAQNHPDSFLGEGNMSVDVILQRLAKVRKTGQEKWMACCPAHDDQRASLSIRRIADEGIVLIHCFAGCAVCDVLASLGMTFADLYPPMKLTGHSRKPAQRPWNSTDVLNALAFEILVALNYARYMANGNVLDESDRERLTQCAARMLAGLGLINE